VARMSRWIIAILIFGFGITACQEILPTELDQTQLPTDVGLESLEELPPEIFSVQGQQIRQWAIEAVANSEYSGDEWSAIQAIGAPDTRRCGDYQTAWAAAGSDSQAWIDVKFSLPVHVTAVNIIQSFNPDQVVKIELVGPFDRSVEIFTQQPQQIDQACPYTLPVSVEKTEARYDRVRITLDQSVLGLGWNQIDAVELVGTLE
jgi:hypothetical protein